MYFRIRSDIPVPNLNKYVICIFLITKFVKTKEKRKNRKNSPNESFHIVKSCTGNLFTLF